MKILYDHQAFAFQKYGGITRYFAELIAGTRRHGHQSYWPDGMYAENQHLTESAGFTAHPLFEADFPGKKLLQYYLGRQKSAKAWSNEPPDIFHPTYFDPYFLKEIKHRKIPFVVTVHDMIHEILGYGSSFLSIDAGVVAGKKLLCEQADAIVCVSENTKTDLLRIYPHLQDKNIRVIWHGNSLQPSPRNIDSGPLSPDSYILFTGNRKGYKNFDFFVKALAPLLAENPDLHIVSAGSGPFSADEMQLFNELKIASQVIHQPVSDNNDLDAAYQNALCFVFPSSYEGFGIPILEAFACGTPVVLNNNSSLAEIGGDAALYFNDGDAEGLRNAVFRLFKMQTLHTDFLHKGRERLKLFSWENSVRAHIDLYESLR